MLWILAAVVLAGVALRAALPIALERAIPFLAERQGGARARVGNIDLGLLAGEVTIEDLVVALPTRAGSEDPLLALERIYLDFEWSDLPSRTIHLAALELGAPTVRLRQRADGSFELPVPPAPDAASASASDRAASPGAETSSESSDGWKYALDRFELIDADVSVHSQTADAEVLRLSAQRLGLLQVAYGPEGIALGDIDLDQPEVYAQRAWILGLGGGDGGEGRGEAEPESGSAAPPVKLDRLDIERAGFTVHTDQGPVAVSIRLSVRDGGTGRGHTFPVELGLEIGQGRASLAGRLGLNPLSYEGRFAWTNLSVPPFLLLSYPALVDWLASCRAEGDVQVGFHPEAGTGLTVRGASAVSDLSFKHPETGELAVEWKRLDLTYDVQVPILAPPGTPARYQIDSLDLTGPVLVYTNPPDALDALMRIFQGPTAEVPEAQPEAPGAPPPALAIEELKVADGVLRYVDRSVSPTHQTRVEDLRATLGGVELSPQLAADRIALDGRIQGTGTFRLRGGVRDDRGRIDFELDHLDLVSYDSLARAAGWRIDSGASSLSSQMRISGGRSNADNEIVLHDLSVASQDPGAFAEAFGVPLDVALALLRDVSGDIHLSIPLAVEQGKVGVGLGPVVTSALRRAISGALLSPFKLVGGVLPGGGKKPSFDPIAFEAGSSEIGSDASDRLEALVSLLADRPTLGVALRGLWSEADRPSLALELLTERAVAGEDFPEVEDAGFFARRRVAGALEERAAGKPGALEPEDQALLERYVAALAVPEARFRALADARRDAALAEAGRRGAPAAALVAGAAQPADEPGVALSLRLREAGPEVDAGDASSP